MTIRRVPGALDARITVGLARPSGFARKAFPQGEDYTCRSSCVKHDNSNYVNYSSHFRTDSGRVQHDRVEMHELWTVVGSLPCHHAVCTWNQALGTTVDPRRGRPRGRPRLRAGSCEHRPLKPLSAHYTVSFAGCRTSQLSLPPELVPVAKRWVASYHVWWTIIEEVSALNRDILRPQRRRPGAGAPRRLRQT